MSSLRTLAAVTGMACLCLASAAPASVIDWAQWTVSSTGPTGTATGVTSGNGAITSLLTGQTTSVVLPQASTFGISQFSTVSPPQTFYGLLESPDPASASRDFFYFSGLTANTNQLVYGLTDLKYDLNGTFDGPVTVSLTAYDIANNQIPLNGLQVREQNDNDLLVNLLLTGQDLTMTFNAGSAFLEINPYDNTRTYSHSRMILLDNFPTGIDRIEIVHSNPDTSFIDGVHMGFGVIVPEPSSVALGLTGALGLLIVARRRYNRSA